MDIGKDRGRRERPTVAGTNYPCHCNQQLHRTQEKTAPGTTERGGGGGGGGVENGSTRTDLMENDPGMNMIMNQDQQGNSLMCGQCDRKFDTWQGLRVHQGKVCMRKRRQCRSTDRKTRSKSSQDDNHSEAISASVDSPATPSQSGVEQQTQNQG